MWSYVTKNVRLSLLPDHLLQCWLSLLLIANSASPILVLCNVDVRVCQLTVRFALRLWR